MRQRRTSDEAEEHQREYRRQRTRWRHEGGDMSKQPKKTPFLQKLESILKLKSDIVINELNSVSKSSTGDLEFIELKHSDPCIFARETVGNYNGPPLSGHYLVIAVGSSNGLKIDLIANLSNHHFKHNSSLFVIGQGKAKPDLHFTDSNVMHTGKALRRRNQSNETDDLNEEVCGIFLSTNS